MRALTINVFIIQNTKVPHGGWIGESSLTSREFVVMQFFVKPIEPETAVHVRQQLVAGCESMKARLSGLTDSHGRITEEIHATRKLGKSLRGGLALFGLRGTACREIQAIGRLLSGSRDAASRIHTWQKLGWNEVPSTAAAILGILEIQMDSSRRKPAAETIAWCQDRVDAVVRELSELSDESMPGQIESGAAKLEKRLIKRCLRLRHDKPERFHEARKAVKAWLGAMDYLPSELRHIPSDYHHLAESLGDENDLATLMHWLERYGFTDHLAPELWHFLRKNRRELQEFILRMVMDRGDHGKKVTSPA